jgi:hypothetical protein
MAQTKGIAIRIDSDLLEEIENQNINRNDLVTKAIESYLHNKETPNKKPKKKTEKTKSPWAKIEEESEKLNQLSKNKVNVQAKKQHLTTEDITSDLYNEIYSTIYNTEVTPLKKQIELKDNLIKSLEKQNDTNQEDKRFLYDHIKNLEQRIPSKHSWFQKKK